MIGRFHVVASAIGIVAVVALLALAYDQTSYTAELESDDTESQLQAIKQQQADLLAKEKQLEAKLAAKKIQSKKEARIEKLKKELAAAEADSGDSSSSSSSSSSSDSSSDSTSAAKTTSDSANAQKLVTADDFKHLSDNVAAKQDNGIAKEAGLKPMGWMGSKEQIDATLRKYGCDPTSFTCKGSPAQKKMIAKKLAQLQEALLGDGQQVEAYGWKEEHALPPAPKMN